MKHFCEHASRLVSDRYERPLMFAERWRLRWHLLICRACHHYAQSMIMMHRLMQQLREQPGEGTELSAAQRTAIRDILKKKCRQ